MKWIKITDERGEVINEKLPKTGNILLYCSCGYVFQRDAESLTNRGSFLQEMGVTHYALIAGPDEPQPEVYWWMR